MAQALTRAQLEELNLADDVILDILAEQDKPKVRRLKYHVFLTDAQLEAIMKSDIVPGIDFIRPTYYKKPVKKSASPKTGKS